MVPILGYGLTLSGCVTSIEYADNGCKRHHPVKEGQFVLSICLSDDTEEKHANGYFAEYQTQEKGNGGNKVPPDGLGKIIFSNDFDMATIAEVNGNAVRYR